MIFIVFRALQTINGASRVFENLSKTLTLVVELLRENQASRVIGRFFYKKIEKLEMGRDEKQMRSTRPTRELIDKILDILERNGARDIGRWKSTYITFFQDELSEYMALLMLKELQSNKEFVKNVVKNLSSTSERRTTRHRLRVIIFSFSYPELYYSANDLRGIRQDVHEVLKEAKSYLLRHNEKRRHINAIVDILEKNGARNIRQWVRDIALRR